MNISLIVAAASNNVIGKANQLPWHLPNDLKFFKNTTWGMPVIMGRKTFESVNKVLPGRFNIVVTRQPGWSMEGVIVASGSDDAIQKAKDTGCKEAFIIGGGELFKAGMERADKIYMTRVHADIEGDVLFPAIDESIWKQAFNLDCAPDEKHAFAYSFQTWERQNNS
jgi:dihydrofolate reductase